MAGGDGSSFCAQSVPTTVSCQQPEGGCEVEVRPSCRGVLYAGSVIPSSSRSRELQLQLPDPQLLQGPLHLHPLHSLQLHSPVSPRLPSSVRRNRVRLLRRRLPLPSFGTQPTRLRPLRHLRADDGRIQADDGRSRAAGRHQMSRTERGEGGGGREDTHVHHALLVVENAPETVVPSLCGKHAPANPEGPGELSPRVGGCGEALGGEWGGE